MREDSLKVEILDQILKSNLSFMSNGLKELIEPNGAKEIVDFILFR